jgi:hypothetical protein
MSMFRYDPDVYNYRPIPERLYIRTEDYPYEPLPSRAILRAANGLINDLAYLYNWDKKTASDIEKLQWGKYVPGLSEDDIEELESLLLDNKATVARRHRQLNLFAKYLKFCPFLG